MSYITLNGVNVLQPSADGGVKEEYLRAEKDVQVVTGVLQRLFIAPYWQVTLVWKEIDPANYAIIYGMIWHGQPIVYSNSASAEAGGALSFTGLPMHSVTQYIPGSSLLRQLQLVLRQGVT